jgi:hypothetical protein
LKYFILIISYIKWQRCHGETQCEDLRNVMTGSFTNAVSDIVNTAKSAVNRKLSNRNVVGSSATARYRAREEESPSNELPAIESSDDESHPQAGLPAAASKFTRISKRKRKHDQPSSQLKQTQHWMGKQQLNTSSLRIQ